jgi:hypothetical protein
LTWTTPGGPGVVHVNLTRGLDGGAAPAGGAVKLDGTGLRHAVRPVDDARLGGALSRPVAVLALHGQLAAVAWAFCERAPGARLGYVQTAGGALSGGRSRTVAALRERGLLAGHITAGAAFGAEAEAITTAGALDHGLRELGWDAAVCGPGPEAAADAVVDGGMAALDAAHLALALGCPTALVARMSSGARRAGAGTISRQTLTILDLLLGPVTVALPAGMRSPVGSDLRAGLGAISGSVARSRPAVELDVERPARIARHDWRRAAVDLPAFAASGLPASPTGTPLTEDPLFFAAALAGGGVLGELSAESRAVAAEAGSRGG